MVCTVFVYDAWQTVVCFVDEAAASTDSIPLDVTCETAQHVAGVETLVDVGADTVHFDPVDEQTCVVGRHVSRQCRRCVRRRATVVSPAGPPTVVQVL